MREPSGELGIKVSESRKTTLIFNGRISLKDKNFIFAMDILEKAFFQSWSVC